MEWNGISNLIHYWSSLASSATLDGTTASGLAAAAGATGCGGGFAATGRSGGFAAATGAGLALTGGGLFRHYIY
jgi:hypothetical protein